MPQGGVGGRPLTSTPPAHAGDRTCSGSIGAASVDGNVIVNSGATLTVRGASMGGNIRAENRHVVVVGSRIVDDVERRTRVGGSIQREQGGGGLVLRAVVGADAQVRGRRRRSRIPPSTAIEVPVVEPDVGLAR